MIAYKLFRELKDGNITPLFINKKLRLPFNEWMPAEEHRTKGFAFRPGWHCTHKAEAPHLSSKGRIWCKVEIEDYEIMERPKHQGGTWYLAKKMRILERI